MARRHGESRVSVIVQRHLVVPRVNRSAGRAVAHGNVLAVGTAGVGKHTVLLVKVVLSIRGESRVPGDGGSAVLGAVLVVGREAGTGERVGNRSRSRSRRRLRSRRGNGDDRGLGNVGNLIIGGSGSGRGIGGGRSRRGVGVLGDPAGALGAEQVSKLVDVDDGHDRTGGGRSGSGRRVGAVAGDGDNDVFVGGDNDGGRVLVDGDNVLGDGNGGNNGGHEDGGAKARKDLHIENVKHERAELEK